MNSLRNSLFSAPPFAGQVPHVPPDLSGWGSEHPIFEAAVRGLKPERVIEVGTWKGASAIHMAKLMRQFAIDGEIICVDTWLGAPIAWTTHRELMPSLRLEDGYPQLYRTFARNVRDAGVADFITPLPASADGAATILRYYGIRAKLIYIDGDHDFEPCLRDLETYFPLLEPGGVLIADDFGCFPGVTEAVTGFAEAQDLYALKRGEKVALSRSDLWAVLDMASDGLYDRRPTQGS